MVKKKVLEMYSEQYRAGGGELDMSAESTNSGGDKGPVDKMLAWWVARQTRRSSGG
jgi:hypothetical protein